MKNTCFKRLYIGISLLEGTSLDLGICLGSCKLETMLWSSPSVSLPSRRVFWVVSGISTWACSILPFFRYISGPRDLEFSAQRNWASSRACTSFSAPLSSSFPGLTRLLVCSLLGAKGARGAVLWGCGCGLSLHRTLEFPIHACETWPVRDRAGVGRDGDRHHATMLGSGRRWGAFVL